MFSREPILARITDQSLAPSVLVSLFVLLFWEVCCYSQSFVCVITDVETVGMSPLLVLLFTKQSRFSFMYHRVFDYVTPASKTTFIFLIRQRNFFIAVAALFIKCSCMEIYIRVHEWIISTSLQKSATYTWRRIEGVLQWLACLVLDYYLFSRT